MGSLTPRDTDTGSTLYLFLTDRRQEALQSSATSQCQELANLSFALVAKSSKFWRFSPGLKAKIWNQWCKVSLYISCKYFSFFSPCNISVLWFYDSMMLNLCFKRYLLLEILHACWSYPKFWVDVEALIKWNQVFKILWQIHGWLEPVWACGPYCFPKTGPERQHFVTTPGLTNIFTLKLFFFLFMF